MSSLDLVGKEDAEAFAKWLMQCAIESARGDNHSRLTVRPDGRFWLGRVAPQEKVENGRLGERGERLEPCAIGVRVRLDEYDGRRIRCKVRACAWREVSDSKDPDTEKWVKTDYAECVVILDTPKEIGRQKAVGRSEISAALSAVGAQGLAAEVQAEVEPGKDGPELVVSLVNVSPEELVGLDTTLYETSLEARIGKTEPFLLEGLEDAFRYDRRVPAYGVNGGVESLGDGAFRTNDFGVHDRRRLVYWDQETAGSVPDLSFARLVADPVAPLRELAAAFESWVDGVWSEESLETRADDGNWSDTTVHHAHNEAVRAREECARVATGVRLLENDDVLRRSFQLANESFLNALAVSHTGWRPFQIGFVLANLLSLESETSVDRDVADTLWFATGGGKTETYLLYSLTAAFHDRLTQKLQGITSWARFPLRMLSLDQTQRFVDVMASAELTRQKHGIAGDVFSVGFFVGKDGTPNSIPREPRPGDPDHEDATMPARYRVLLKCPFCLAEQIEMRFDKQRWALDHVCTARECPWQQKPIPFRIVDEEIYRWLPTIVIGTLDKAASVSMQAAMRGFYGAPQGVCPVAGHGFTYVARSKTPTGCLFPGCNAPPLSLKQEPSRFGPTIRMQDELHLLRDSLGSVDSHYEALLDGLQKHWGSTPKLIASSATLAGHDEQVMALYRRRGRTFPVPGPSASRSFWSMESTEMARRYVGVAPRGVTIEYANDQLVTTLQTAVRRTITEPDVVARQARVSEEAIPGLLSLYGVDVVYGSTLKDVEAVARSFEAQIPLHPLTPVSLTGRTPLDEVRDALKRLKEPEPDFAERIHLVAASSMLSHGVDIDRLNVMVMLGMPLSTAEFIQTTSRVGRSFAGLVFVMHKIGRERDAGVFRVFPSFIEHMDRLIDPVSITSKSRRVLELTFSGLEQGRIYGIHESQAISRGLKQLTTPASLRKAFTQLPVLENSEVDQLIEMLKIGHALDEGLRADLREYLRKFYRELNDPASAAQWVSDLFSTGSPMISLRDVEQQVPVYSKGGSREG